MFKINKVYEAILAFAGAYPDAEGYISQTLLGKKTPFVVNELPVVMAVERHLQNPADKVIFHPLAESAIRGESEVTEKFRRWINIKLNITIGVIGQALLNLVASPELHSKLTPEQSELMIKIREANPTSVTNFIKLMTAGCKANPDSLYVNLYLRRGGEYNGKKSHCAGIAVFPFYLKLQKNEITNIREGDKLTFKQIMEFILPGIDGKEDYNYGSYSTVAKFMDALMMSAGKIACRLNEVLRLYKDHIDAADDLIFDEEWIQYFNDVDALLPDIRQIPMQMGNEGTSLMPVPQTQAPQTIQTVNQPQVQQHYMPVPQQQRPPEPVKPGGKISMADLRAANPVLNMQQGLWQQPGYGVPGRQQLPMSVPNPGWDLGATQQPQQYQQPLQYGQPQQTQVLVPGAVVQTQQGAAVVSATGQLIPISQGAAVNMQPQMNMNQPMNQQKIGWGDLRGRVRA